MSHEHMPTAELGFWGRYWRRVQAGLPWGPGIHCRTCGNHLNGRPVTFCSEACSDRDAEIRQW